MSEKTISRQIANVLLTIEALAGHEFNPLRTKDVADALSTSPPQATRMLQQLELCGWVEQTPDQKWRLKHGKMTNIACAVQGGIRRAKSRLDDQANNLTRSPY